ncbi:hypothetical protein EG864_15150, partial [Enterococcus faecalis]
DGGAGVKRVHVDGGGAGHVGMRADRFSRYLSGAGHQQAVGGHAIVGSIRHFRFLRIAEPDVEAGAGRLLGAHVQPVVLVAAELVLGVQARVRPLVAAVSAGGGGPPADDARLLVVVVVAVVVVLVRGQAGVHRREHVRPRPRR